MADKINLVKKKTQPSLQEMFPEGLPAVLATEPGSPKVESLEERIIMSCCGMTIWRRRDENGFWVESFGWSINKDSMVCSGCYKRRKLTGNEGN